MAIKVAINGFGRIGRLAFRLMHQSDAFEVVALNDLSNADELAYLLKYDTAQGRFPGQVSVEGEYLVVDGKKAKILAVRDPKELPWKDLGIDVVLECTGLFLDEEKASAHLVAGAKKVVLSAPASSKNIKTIVYNVNHNVLDGSESIISGASCTTNCLAPMIDVLDKEFGVEWGFMTTVHAYTNDQSLMDQPHKKGYMTRRGRAAAASIIPSTTGAAKAVGKVLPHLNGKLDGTALRVPTITGSIVDLSVELKKQVSVEEINQAFKKASNESLVYTEDPIVSADIVGSPSSIFDANTTQILNAGDKQVVKVMSWYDNEMTYTAQLIRTLKYFASLIK
ncbi:glyceraldehyde 3-phosphate dehydrogenase [Acholeplasma morum]|uniref:type I glyceraldehyde-3-phosphate dehydrogenase n=1 Tax=Paracholeplasma morum TaxID=264637 RepID=UPI001958A01A|nr:type I glyceraldehyde-3-phosphate dehydrogenase [Paracholeplasma morum]MBM7453436.1 glyceraldehyde 3-phosphate dehydrogenase [Paracholeplasma morum]